MRSKIITRKLDETGRIVLPKAFREVLGIKRKDDVEISLDDGCITLKKPQKTCSFCGGADVIIFKGKPLCKKCIDEIKISI